MDLKNYFCPVCSNDFNEDDDVVFCPECGTPHHRDCYINLGECKNSALHNENFTFEPVIEEQEKIDILIDDEIKNTKDVVNVVNVEFNSDDEKNNEDICDYTISYNTYDEACDEIIKLLNL